MVQPPGWMIKVIKMINLLMAGGVIIFIYPLSLAASALGASMIAKGRIFDGD